MNTRAAKRSGMPELHVHHRRVPHRPRTPLSRRPSAWGRARHVARTWLSERPALYLPLARRRYPGPTPEVIGPDTELVIDGYTRAASTYLVYAFQLAQERPIRLAHHLHAPAQIIEAARRALPTLVLVRDPDESALSQAVQEPHVTVRDALFAYARFHERLLPYRDSFVVADFEEVTRDIKPAVHRLNDRFGTVFRLPDAEDEPLVTELVRLRPTDWPMIAFESGRVSRAEVLAALADPKRRPAPAADPDEWVPSERRRLAKQARRAELERPQVRAVRRRAWAAYGAMFEAAG
ncbi:hypothetical protein [Geodermatophilus ruber]|uniref:Sulfotransferase family protein n=1 Tax=Geodermatophilus ruber TaxID=504800 RepID=A0A1I4LCJ7_9ACTN|nr:hypothetical protein [Geodermatophilus ruber]SFL88523.1 hypothetical protein SAMN04488085_12116 [Geodermatophilus ruber]